VDLDIDPIYPLIGTSIISPRCSEATVAIWNEGLANDPYKKNTLKTKNFFLFHDFDLIGCHLTADS